MQCRSLAESLDDDVAVEDDDGSVDLGILFPRRLGDNWRFGDGEGE
jgi:hypothetical protein